MSKKVKESDIKNMPNGGAVIAKKGKDVVITNDGKKGGYFAGRSHKEGGIKAIVETTGQPIEIESNEIIINKVSVADPKVKTYIGTNKEILSKINSENGNGVSFAEGGEVNATLTQKLIDEGKTQPVYNEDGIISGYEKPPESQQDKAMDIISKNPELLMSQGGKIKNKKPSLSEEAKSVLNNIKNRPNKMSVGGSVEETYRTLLTVPKEEAISIINKAIGEDYFFVLDEGSLNIVSENVYKMFLYCFPNNKTHPYISNFGDKIVFEPHPLLVEKQKTYLLALIKYAAHFFTQEFFIFIREKRVRRRTLDMSKSSNFDMLTQTILNPDKKLKDTTREDRMYYFKYLKGDNNTLVCFNICVEGNVIVDDNVFLESVTFMPDKRDTWLESQIASGKYKDLTEAIELRLPTTLIEEDYVDDNQDDTINPAKISIDQTKLNELINKYKKNFAEGGEIVDPGGIDDGAYTAETDAQAIEYDEIYQHNLISDEAIVSIHKEPHDGNSEVYRGKKSLERGGKIKDESYTEWEGAVTDAVSEKADCTHGDASAIVEANEFVMSQCWGKRLGAAETADKILFIKKDSYAKGGPVKDKKIKLIDIPASLKHFIPAFQQKALIGTTEHWGVLDRLEDIVKEMPVTRGSAPKIDDKIIYLHYFYGNSDWYIAEKDMEKNQLQAFSYAILNGDTEMAEWGYIDIEELSGTCKVEIDFFFEPIKFGELKRRWVKEKTDNALIGYHGTTDKGFHSYKYTYYTADRDYAKEYAEGRGRIIKSKIDIKKPFRIEARMHGPGAIELDGCIIGFYRELTDSAVEKLKEKGYDGILVDYPYKGKINFEIIPFDSSQVIEEESILVTNE